MPVEYTIFTSPQLNYIRYHGHVVLDEIMTALQQFAREPAFANGQPHYFDLSQVTSYEIDYHKFFRVMAKIVDVYPRSAGEHMMAFHAPPGPPAELAAIVRKPWIVSDTILIRVCDTKEQVFDILGGARDDLLAHIKAFA
jgi:hypothetical protein